MMKKLILFLILFSGFQGFAQQQAPLPAHKVIMQMSSSDTLVHKGLINQLNALKEYWGAEVAIEVLLLGPGVDMVVRDRATQVKAISLSREKGVRFIVCENTLKQRKIEKDKLILGLDFVAFGQVHLITRQEEGWSYIKVGF
jgi:intracellular sulfur oxidation DsrE/DsrF family protein